MIFEGIFLTIVIGLVMIFGKMFCLDYYWLIEDNAIYYFSKDYLYRRIPLTLTFKSEKHLME
jgi:hypothetical protein